MIRLPPPLYRGARTIKRTITDRGGLRAERAAFAMQYWSAQRTETHQIARLQRMLEHAYATTDHYRHVLDEAGLSPASIDSIDALQQLPTLEKATLHADLASLVSSTYADRIEIVQSSGSTGQPMNFGHLPGLNEVAGMKFLSDQLCRMAQGERTLQIWGRDVGGMSSSRDRFDRFAYFSVLHMTESELSELVDFTIAWRPRVVIGYVSVLVLVAERLLDRGINGVGATVVQTHAEPLLAHQRSLIERAFGGRAFDFYGSNEVQYLGCECEQHNGMHLFTPYRICEIDDAAHESGRGELLITDLVNPAMPMIRYRNGDIVELISGECPCGRSMPRIRVEGRKIDLFRMPNGDVLYSVFFEKLMDQRQVRHFLVHQRSTVDVDLHLVPTQDYRNDYGRGIAEQISNRTGAAVSVKLADALPAAIAGKSRLVRSDVTESHLGRATEPGSSQSDT